MQREDSGTAKKLEEPISTAPSGFFICNQAFSDFIEKRHPWRLDFTPIREPTRTTARSKKFHSQRTQRKTEKDPHAELAEGRN